MSPAVTRRQALATSAATALGLGAGTAAVQAAPALSAKDRRLVAIAAEIQATDDRLSVLSATHEQAEDLPEWDALIERFTPLEEEMVETPADTLAGVLAKARAAQVQPVANCVNGIADSLTADLVRLFGGGADA
ncbi:hypothetical protein D3273_13330 [Lichenibacterium minor]|uniref:Twin-arginine translocation signal domain-containing protein n=1 Tax=Lichenibacterium minor TaxID=2316528 RepID=A0A4Q2U8Q5_9HYPH|nr:hypothetical protein [Lichenibacterium minor]RYC31366.1 hypothetical protein D3273_13330 [Lichenibacterium minor]